MDKPQVQIIGEDGNAFTILGKVRRSMVDHGCDKEYIEKYMEEAMSGDYDHLLRVTMEYCEVY